MRKNLSWLLGAALTALLAVPAGWLLFTHFMVYDDEGYVLWSLKNYAEVGALYTRVYSQYGPAFFAAYDALHRATGFAFTNENGRWITLVFWCATAWLAGDLAARLAGGVVARLAGGVVARLAAIGLAFAALSVMSSEPIHPGGPLVCATALVAWCGVVALLNGRTRWLAIATGGIGAAALLTKINVGVFLLIAGGSWLFLHGPWREQTRRQLGTFLLLGAVAAPLVLMRAKLGDPRYAGYALLVASAAAALALLLRRQARTEVTPGDWAAGALAAAGVVAVVIASVLWRGTTWSDLVHGVAIAPFKQTAVYSFPPRSALPAVLLALAGLGASAWLVSRSALSPRLLAGLASARLLAALGIIAVVPEAADHATGRYLFYGVTALAWLFAWPLRGEGSPAARARLWLAWLFVWQTLHAFPVAGSQVAWGALLGAPLLVVGTVEAIEVLFAATRWRAAVAGGVLVAVALAPCVSLARTGWLYEKISPRLGLPGAERLALPPNLTHGMQALSRNVRLHGGLLFSHPGMFSFNLWTGHPTPTVANVTLWSTLLSDGQQAEIQARLAADPRAVIISQEYVLSLLIGQGFAPQGELNRFLVQNFTPAFRIDTYVFWVRKDRTIAPVGTARLAATADGRGWSIELVTDAAGRAATWQLWTNGLPVLVASGDFAATQPSAMRLQPDGTPAGPARSLAEGNLPGALCRVQLTLPSSKLPPADDLELRLLAADGRTLESVPFRR